jgi:replicative DNA helicase
MNLEAQVISAVCANKDISAVFADGTDDLFTSHKDVWLALKSYYYKYKSIPDVSVLHERYRDFEPTDAPGATAFYVEQLRDEYVGGRMRDIIKTNGMLLGTDSSPRVLEKIQKELADLNKFTNSVRDLDVTDFASAEDYYRAQAERAALMGGSVGIPTGFKAIDAAYYTGMAPGHLIVVIGWPGKGKTWATAKLAVNAWKQGFKPMIVSLEMSPETMRDRLYTVMGEGQFRNSQLARGEVNIDDFHSWGKKNFADKDGFVVVSNEGVSDVTPNTVQSKIDRHKPDLVICDYHQLFMDNRKSEAMTTRAMNISREFKLLAVSNNIPVVDITAATMSETSDQNDPPMLNQVAWSKAIEYDADMAFAVHRTPDTVPAIIEIASRKNRHGDEFDFFVEWDIDSGEVKETF